MKSSPISLFPLYICLLAALVLITSMPTAVLAATGTASCAGGQTVSCSAYKCVCTDNDGCTAYDSAGNKVEDIPCPANDGPMLAISNS
jgi:hypothetical protein